MCLRLFLTNVVRVVSAYVGFAPVKGGRKKRSRTM